MSDFFQELPSQLDVPESRRSRGRVVALAVATVAVVVAGAFAAVSLTGNDDNAPTDPVRAMFDAAQRGDAIGVLEQLDPGERDALRGPLTDLTEQLNRLGVLKDASLSHISGVDLKITDLQLEATTVRDGLAEVHLTGGKSAYTIDPDKLPLGKFIRDLAGDSLSRGKTSGSSDLKSSTSGDGVAVVKRGGHWYVSLGYSAAEGARKDQKVSIADLGDGVPAAGAATPEDAVRDLVGAIAKLDVHRMIELMPPDELPSLHEYAGLFIDDAKHATDDVKDSYSVTISTLDLDADTSGDQSLVTIKKIELSGTFGDFTLSFKNGCADFTVPGGSPQHVCQGANPTDVLKSLGMASDLAPPQFSFTGKHPKVGIVATKVDGKWYVSPTRTVLDDLVASLKLVQPSDLDKGRDWFQQLTQSFSGGD